MSDTDRGDAAWGDSEADLRAVIEAQRATIAHLQEQRDADERTIARLEAALRADLDGGPPPSG